MRGQNTSCFWGLQEIFDLFGVDFVVGAATSADSSNFGKGEIFHVSFVG